VQSQYVVATIFASRAFGTLPSLAVYVSAITVTDEPSLIQDFHLRVIEIMKQHNSKLRVSSSLLFAFLLTGSIFPARAQSCSTPGFSQPAVYAVGTGDTRATAAADFDGDGKPDLAIADNGGDTLTASD
jgi:hypothetical protein